MKRLLPLLAMLLLFGSARAATPLPGDSVYNLPLQLTDQDGHRQTLADRRGRPQLVTMFYTSCQMVCPMIIDSLRLTRNALDPATRARIDLLAVSFDPARDGVATLKSYAEKRKLDPRIWTLARAEPAQVRQLSGVLGLQYRQLPDGEFNHFERTDPARCRRPHRRPHRADRQARSRVRGGDPQGGCAAARLRDPLRRRLIHVSAAVADGEQTSRRTSGDAAWLPGIRGSCWCTWRAPSCSPAR